MSTEVQPSDTDGPGNAAGESATNQDGVPFSVVMLMDDVFDKLVLLNYDKEYVQSSTGRKAIPQHYFAVVTNPGEQFYTFTGTAAWLIQHTGNKQFEMPQEYDDPNATISKILDQVRQLGHNVDFPPNKLKQGAGEHCLYILDKLADSALVAKQFEWKKCAAEPEPAEDLEATADEAEITAEDFIEEEEPEMAEDEDEGGYLDLQALRPASGQTQSEPLREMLKSDTDAVEWRLEVERVLPSLKVTVRQDAKDWRSHLEQMQMYHSNIQSSLLPARAQLDRLATNVQNNLQKINSREKYLNSQLESLLTQFRTAQDQLAEAREKYKEASGGVTDRSRVLAELTDELEQTRHDMEQRGLNLTDGAPLVKLKQAIGALEQELIGMEVELGVIEQALLQSQLRDVTSMHSQSNIMRR